MKGSKLLFSFFTSFFGVVSVFTLLFGASLLPDSFGDTDGFGFSHKFEVTTADTSVAADDMQYTDQFIEAQDLQVLQQTTRLL